MTAVTLRSFDGPLTGLRDTRISFNRRNVESGVRLLQGLVDDPSSLMTLARIAAGDADEQRRQDLVNKFDENVITLNRCSGLVLLEMISASGLSWRDIARIGQVSVASVQKWRRGDGMTGANRANMARLAAILQQLPNHMIGEPSAWLEAKVLPNVGVTPLDLLAEGRFDLVLALATGTDTKGEVESVLDDYNVDWRVIFVDNDFTVVKGQDGRPVIVAKR